jgi:small GTP-binding protein
MSSSDGIGHSALPNNVLETKVVILGHTGVGETSMLNQFVRGSFTGNTTATIGAAFMKKTIVHDGWNIILQIWDTAGQERFRSMAPMYYRGAHAAVLVFDITSADTLDKVGGWADELSGHGNHDMVLVLAANKCDLREPNGTNAPTQLQIAAQQYARSTNTSYFETSAKTGAGIEEMFQYIAAELLKRHKEKVEEKNRAAVVQSRNTKVRVQQRREPQDTGSCC